MIRTALSIFIIFSGILFAAAQEIPEPDTANAPDAGDAPFTGDAPAADSLLLEDVTISLLPFRETYSRATGSVYRLNTSDLDRAANINPADLINVVPGVRMATGTYSTNRLVIRGVGSRTPYNTNRIRIYLDDIPLTSGDGISSMEDQDPLAIGSIEILKGPSSALYGSGLGGVVRLRSPYPAVDGVQGSVIGEAGSFGTFRYGTLWKFRKNRMAASGGLVRSVSDGFRENNRYERTSAFASLRYFRERHTLSLTLSFTGLFARIPSSLNEEDFTENPTKAASNWLAVNGFEEYRKALVGIRGETSLTPRLKNHLVLFTSFADPYESRPFNILDDRSFNLGFREYLEAGWDHWSLQGGLELFHEWYGWQIYQTLSGEQGEMQSDYREIRKYFNGFALVQWRPDDRFLLDAGLNLNVLNYEVVSLLGAGPADQTGSYTYRPVISPRLGISYRPARLHTLYASAGHGFSAPSLEETLLPDGLINTELKPETGWNMEAGARGMIGDQRWRYDATLYAILLENMLVTERLAEDIFTGANAGRALNTGLELQLKWSLHGERSAPPFNLQTMLGYTISSNRFLEFVDEGVDYSGNHLPGIPRQVLHLQASGEIRDAALRIHYTLNGHQWMDDANEKSYEGDHLVDLELLYDRDLKNAPLGISLRGGIRNLFNTSYASMILVNAPSFGGSLPRYYYPGPPRRIFLGITLRFGSS